jgi:galactokinase
MGKPFSMIGRHVNDSRTNLLVESACEVYARRFGRPPRFGAIAPGRVNLIGDHTDYNMGFVLPIAIDRHTIALADWSQSESSTLCAPDVDQELTLDVRQPLAPISGGFANYVLGVMREFQERSDALRNVDLLITGNLPRGAGLSSSASVEVAIATLLEQMLDVSIAPLEKALLCQRAEHRFAGVPCGIMDMLVIAAACADHALLIDCRSLHHEAVGFPDAHRAALLVFNTGVERSLTGGAYARCREACEEAARELGVRWLRDATVEMIEHSQLQGDCRSKALHVVQEHQRVALAAEALRQGDLATLGELMFVSHRSLRELFEVSVPELDVIVDAAREHATVWGARMTGAGLGGCAIVLCSADAANAIAARIASAFERQFSRAPAYFITGAAAAARPLDFNSEHGEAAGARGA